MDCRKAKKRLQAYPGRELPDKEADSIDEHIRSCSGCAQAADESETAWKILGELQMPEIIPDLVPGTLARLRRQEEESLLVKLQWLLAPAKSYAFAAAVFLLGLSIGVPFGKTISNTYLKTGHQDDPLYLEIFQDIPANSVGDAYMKLADESNGGINAHE